MRAFACSLACLTLPSLALADPPTPVEPVVVTATLTPTPLDQVASSITLITAADIASHQWRSLPDALIAVPGLSAVQTGGPGGETSVFIRGADANHTKVLIDGIEVDDPSNQDDTFDFGQVVTSDLERVEILRGPQSSLYGSDALGGVVNIITRTGEGPPRLDASLEGGSFASFDQSAALSGSTGPFDYAASVSHARSADTPVTPPELLAPGEKALGNFYDNRTVSTKLGLDPGGAFGVQLVVRYTDSDLRSTGEDFSFFPAIPDAAQTGQSARQLFTRGEARLGLFGGAFENVFGVGYADYRTIIQAPDDGFGLPPPTLDRGDRLKLDWLGTITLPGANTLVLGLDDEVERLIDSPIDAGDGERAAFGELQSRPMAGLNLAASVRIDDDDRFGAKATWRIAGSHQIAATGTLIKASYGTGFTAPSLTELFVSFPAFDFFANPALKPETSQGYDLGFEQPIGPARVGVTWFHYAIHDLIDTNAAGDSYVNIGRAMTYGVESFAQVALGKGLTVRADYTYTFAWDDIDEEELLRRPKDKADVDATWQASGKLSLTASLNYVGAWVDGNRDFSIPRLKASPYATVDLAASYALTDRLTLFGRIDNLLDRRYQNPVGFLQPGIGAFAGVRVSLEKAGG